MVGSEGGTATTQLGEREVGHLPAIASGDLGSTVCTSRTTMAAEPSRGSTEAEV